MKLYLCQLFLVFCGYLQAQSFEYVLTEFTGANLNQSVTVKDKIYVSADLGMCSDAGMLVFDTAGTFLHEKLFRRYFSIAPSLIYADSNNSLYILTFWNESEEFYDTTEMEIYQVDLEGNIISQSRLLLEDGYSFYGELKAKIFIQNDTLLVFDGRSVYRYDLELEFIDQYDISDDIYERFKVHQVVDNQVYFSGIDQRSGDLTDIRSIDLTTDSLRYHIDLQGMVSAVTDQGVFVYGIDHALSYFAFQTREMTRLMGFSSEVAEVFIVERNADYFAILSGKDLSQLLCKIDIVNSMILDTLWRFESLEKVRSVALADNYVNTLSVVFDLGMDYGVLRRHQLDRQEDFRRPDIHLDEVKVLREFTPDPNRTEHDAGYLQDLPAIYEVTVTNGSDFPIDNFGFYSEALGGSFCVEGRVLRYIEHRLVPGDSYTFIDSIYPDQRPVFNFDLGFYVFAPNHLLDQNISNDSLSAGLFTTSVGESTASSLSLFPNPATNTIQLDISHADQVEIFDVRGRRVKTFSGSRSTHEVGDLTKGIYFIKANSMAKSYLGKFVKK